MRQSLEDLATKLQTLGAEVLIQTVDLRQESDILAFFQTIRQRWGGVDVLINNAGLGHNQSLLDGDTEAHRRPTTFPSASALGYSTRASLS